MLSVRPQLGDPRGEFGIGRILRAVHAAMLSRSPELRNREAGRRTDAS